MVLWLLFVSLLSGDLSAGEIYAQLGGGKTVPSPREERAKGEWVFRAQLGNLGLVWKEFHPLMILGSGETSFCCQNGDKRCMKEMLSDIIMQVVPPSHKEAL